MRKKTETQIIIHSDPYFSYMIMLGNLHCRSSILLFLAVSLMLPFQSETNKIGNVRAKQNLARIETKAVDLRNVYTNNNNNNNRALYNITDTDTTGWDGWQLMDVWMVGWEIILFLQRFFAAKRGFQYSMFAVQHHQTGTGNKKTITVIKIRLSNLCAEYRFGVIIIIIIWCVCVLIWVRSVFQ